MPEVPTLKLHFGVLSDTDATDTDRSDSNSSTAASHSQPPTPTPAAVHATHNDVRDKRSLDHEQDKARQRKSKKAKPFGSAPQCTTNHTQNARKMRSSGTRLVPQKPLKCSQKLQPAKATAAAPATAPATATAITLNAVQSLIPRALHGTAAAENSHAPSAPSRLVLQRQPTAAILKFRARKSVSQMDLKHARRAGNYMSNVPGGRGGDENTNNNKTPFSRIANAANAKLDASHSQASIIDSLLNRHYFNTPERESRCAGMRIFASIMLNAWRKRRDDVKRLTQEVDELKRGSIKSKNQLHVFNTLFRVEQRRNDELTCQLKRSAEDINSAKSSCESLTTSLISLKADKALVEQELSVKEREFEDINEMLAQTKSDLFKAMTQQRELQSNLSMEQRKVQNLENQKNELINEICELNNYAKQKEDTMCANLQSKETELLKAKETMQKYDDMLKDLNSKNDELLKLMDSEDTLKLELQTLKVEAEALRKHLSTTLDNRLKNCWEHTTAYHRATFNILHLMLFCVLPAVPAPKMTKIPFALSLEKALRIVRR